MSLAIQSHMAIIQRGATRCIDSGSTASTSDYRVDSGSAVAWPLAAHHPGSAILNDSYIFQTLAGTST
jgi:hypothetical protein